METVINLALGLLMFSVGLNIELKDFKAKFTEAKIVILGVLLQLCLPLLLAYTFIVLFNLEGYLAYGVLLGAAVPGGATSAVVTYWAGGDTALSVFLTSFSSIIVSVVTLPIVIYFSHDYLLSDMNNNGIDVVNLLQNLILFVLIPIFGAIIIRSYFQTRFQRIKYLFDYYMIFYYVIVFIAGFVILFQQNYILENIWLILIFISIASNTILLFCGYSICSFFGFSHYTSKTIAIETSFQNNSLAMALALTLIGNEIASIPPMIYGIVMTLFGLIIVFFEKRNSD